LLEGPALGIGQGCDGLGPLSVRGPIFFKIGVYKEIFGFGGYIMEISIKGPKHWYDKGLGWSQSMFLAFLEQFDIYTLISHKNFYIHPPYKILLAILNNVPKKLLLKKLVIFLWPFFPNNVPHLYQKYWWYFF